MPLCNAPKPKGGLCQIKVQNEGDKCRFHKAATSAKPKAKVAKPKAKVAKPKAKVAKPKTVKPKAKVAKPEAIKESKVSSTIKKMLSKIGIEERRIVTDQGKIDELISRLPSIPAIPKEYSKLWYFQCMGHDTYARHFFSEGDEMLEVKMSWHEMLWERKNPEARSGTVAEFLEKRPTILWIPEKVTRFIGGGDFYVDTKGLYHKHNVLLNEVNGCVVDGRPISLLMKNGVAYAIIL